MRSGLRLTVLVGESDQYRHRPLYAEIVHRAHQAGLAGASVFRGIEGFGSSSLVHTQRLLSLSEDLPVAVVIVDAAQRVREFLPRLRGLVPEGTAVLDACEIVALDGAGTARTAETAGTPTAPETREAPERQEAPVTAETPGEAPGTGAHGAHGGHGAHGAHGGRSSHRSHRWRGRHGSSGTHGAHADDADDTEPPA
ncbi:hypothetical protein SLNWT_3500 [Streptomyces albus]|uniref:Uncharacterized protein n=1 Tax=Streptomyces albus (strain ATCC 21838 / DSM 41398 / FERM P-419 / JCM 4703 / NBRC 107858) TaxID=1081613 RepID=A0A0B5EZ31_STRA4|nr:hypothetical protein SLNWT_3500 [Streptomyces albus]AOU78180.1 hypothetical protein SLNHY_3489 [Streptomyces albus]AYN33934.1 hypothetical protein DUI70_3433 [Streptomyces albus]